MCGIAGIISLNGRPIPDVEKRIIRMNKLLKHRGPDAKGYFISKNNLVALGNTRLAIVDAKNNFNVPMQSQNQKQIISFNGEIYNFQELKLNLEKKGVTFNTNSDTEVLLNGLKNEGEDFLQKLDGFWSFAYYDESLNQIMLSRDLLGEKSLFYYQNKNEFIFASEINPILEVAEESFEIENESIVSCFRYRAAPPQKTLVKNIYRIEAGYGFKIFPGESKLQYKRFRKLKLEKWIDFFKSDPSEKIVKEKLEELIYRSCLSRVPAEVNFLSTLSGGIDSSLMNLYASRFGKNTINTLFGKNNPDEAVKGNDLTEFNASAYVSKKLGSKHHTFTMYGDSVVSLYREQAANSFDGIFCEGSVHHRQLSLETNRLGGKVLLLSDGPDELLSGYSVDISAMQLNGFFTKRPMLSKICSRLSSSSLGRRMLPTNLSRQITNWSHLSNAPFRFRPYHGGTTPDILGTLFQEKEIKKTDHCYGTYHQDYKDIAQHLSISQKMALAYATTTMPDYFNLRSDRGAMRHSVETRLPMQNIELAEFMIATPKKYRFSKDRKNGKKILRTLVKKHIGEKISSRSKYGFAIPTWMIKKFYKKFEFQEIIRESDAMQLYPFKKEAKKFFMNPKEGRHQWMALCLIMVKDRLKRKDYGFKDIR
ncbi:MAG: asparagine synthase (glutamine-hydrolyzing) [Pseudomonadota bacterium]|nr:asparagine synthase (glutamine-hydrolyzing) [Pseudomonadota bacterium]